MTIANTSNKNEYTGNGSIVAFDYAYPIDDAGHMKVYLDGVLLGSGYSVSGVGSAVGGTVTLNTAPASGVGLTLLREVPLTQQTDYAAYDAFPEETHEAALDKLTKIAQQLAESDSRQLNRAPGALNWNAFGRRITNVADAADDQDAATLSDAESKKQEAIAHITSLLNNYSSSDLAFAALAAPDSTVLVGGTTAGQINKRLRRTISADEYGYSHTATAVQNKAALKAAVAACSRGFTLLIPETGGVADIDTTLGESDAVIVDKQITIKLHGRMQANYGALEANPATIFKITAAKTVLTGGGCIYGEGTVDDTNAGDTNTIPSLVLVTADECKVSVDFDTPPKTAINLRNCLRCKVRGGTFRGGLESYTVGNTAYFAVYMAGGGKHKIFKNNFIPSDSGGRFITSVFSAYSTRNEVFSNEHDKPFEKAVYLFGDDNQIHDEQCYGDPYDIPGVTPAVKGTMTSVYRVNGSRNRIYNCYSYECLAGATAVDGQQNEITNNTFLKCVTAGVTVFTLSGSAVIAGYKIAGNKSTAWAYAGSTPLAGVYVLAEHNDIVGFDIVGNEADGFGDGTTSDINGVYAAALSPYFIKESRLRGNKTRNGNHGVKAEGVRDSEISSNRAENLSGWALRDNGSTKNKWLDNTAFNVASIGIQGLNADSDASGNSYTEKPLSGIATLANAASTTVTHGGVAPNAKVFLQEAGFSAGALTAITGLLTDVSGNDFRILTGNTGDAGGGEQFWYRIEQ